MDAEGLHLDIDYVGSSGVILSTEQKAAFQSSLVILKNNYKFKRVLFWGKILGVKDDYFIVEGISKDELRNRQILYRSILTIMNPDHDDLYTSSEYVVIRTENLGQDYRKDFCGKILKLIKRVDCVKWGLLPQVTDEMKASCSFVKGRFTGDPSYEYEHTESKKTSDDKDADPEQDEETTILVKEEDRLATVIQSIKYDVSIVPRGAFLRAANGDIYRNRNFEGLSIADAGKLCSYFHFREPILLNQKTLLQKASLDKSIDFLDPIDVDIPKGGRNLIGSWSVQYEKGCGLVTLRSLHWLGFIFYHVPETRKFGCVYVGTGEKNLDLPFML